MAVESLTTVSSGAAAVTCDESTITGVSTFGSGFGSSFTGGATSFFEKKFSPAKLKSEGNKIKTLTVSHTMLAISNTVVILIFFFGFTSSGATDGFNCEAGVSGVGKKCTVDNPNAS